MLELTDELFLGQGAHRRVYRHPCDPQKCIKITYTDIGSMTQRRELKYLRILRKRGARLSVMPAYLGEVQTNLGGGYVYERVMNADGSRALSLEDFAQSETLLRANAAWIKRRLCDLHDELLANRIVTMVLETQNIMFPRLTDGSFGVKLVNDIGSPVAIPLEYYFAYFAKKKVERRWRQFVKNLRTDKRAWVKKFAQEL